MKQITLIVVGVLILLAIMTAGGAFFIVDETEQVVITQFGKPVGESITTAGLKMKIPFLQKANYFDKRFLEWDGAPNEVPTADKRFFFVDTYARWKIANPLLFFKRLNNEYGAQSRLDDILDGETRNTIAKHDLIEAVRSTNREFVQASDVVQNAEAPKNIQYGRMALEEEVLKNATARVEDLGIEILDFRFKRTNYAAVDRPKVYERMISERRRMAEQFRSEGAGEAARIIGNKERELKSINSDAYRQSQEIRGQSDAEAADIYAKAYNKDPEFYRFIKTMEVYETTLDKDTVLLLGTGGDFLKYLEKAK